MDRIGVAEAMALMDVHKQIMEKLGDYSLGDLFERQRRYDELYEEVTGAPRDRVNGP